ncbi:MAG: WXG100 family type VII secretion target [Clostridiales bacterium]|nr:WXG100 family type VII secretion target [Clostridiales bacterium]
MPEAKFVVTPELLRQTASQCEAQRARYHSIYTKVLGEANTLNPFFKGRAHDAFVRRLQAFENDFRLMEELLFKYVTFLKESARNYDVTDENVAAGANKLKVGK